ncbi:hypothetical protein Dsin_019471 [Dipteronia sinensis]|uniref:Zinc knuckle CX2CX4HX4C domain-containing protein n=1 Tax=Dipteronia sinensis TaxID=43782 RepID=A0AAE0A7A4_9ROSI|nr:hypothetical protein Dsin_019471 [Dipteronia sinensis]
MAAAAHRLNLSLVGKIHQGAAAVYDQRIGQYPESLVGVVRDKDVEQSGECSGEFLRVRVLLGITKPLRKCLRVDVLGDGDETVMLLRYEWLMNHCFWCGRIGQPMRECVDVMRIVIESGQE